jgi:eukaryotic-like serine/threonine-protein kinase
MEVLAEISYTKVKQIGIGQGMNSKVYLADDPQLGGRMAVKEIDKALFGNIPSAYFVEAQAMFQAAHENVVTIQYACQTPALISLAMPYYRRGSLSDRIRDRPLRLSEVLRVAQGVLAGLARIHLAGYIHFVVKPSNVLFSNTDKPMVADFGQSRSISSTGVVAVPPLYFTARPPETTKTGVATSLADIYQVGLLLYRALNGDEFFTSQVPSDDAILMEKIERGKFPDTSQFMPHVPKRLRTLVRKALRVDPKERFQTATEMADTLSRVSLAVDWTVEPLPTRGFCWRASKVGCADMVVELAEQGGTWDVRVFTERIGEPRRAKGRNENWRDGLKLDDAHAHLREIFEGLAQ